MANISYGVNIIPKTNNTYTLGNSDYKWANIFTNKINGTSVSDIIAEVGSGNIEDIQINETSIVDNGTATIPLANTSTYGVVKLGSGLTINQTSGAITTDPASVSTIKAATANYAPIAPNQQHVSVFYGLAKAAGDSTQSASSNSVGNYTSDAKSAIQSMLAVPASSNPVFTGTFSLNRAANTTIGTKSVSIGDGCTASAEDSFAEGRYTTASGYYSHAEGNYTTALGMASHAEGTVTIANHASQHVFGEYNVEDDSEAANYSRGNFVEIVGNGTGSSTQSNARTLDWNGNERLKGDLYVGCNADSTGGTKVARVPVITYDIQTNNMVLDIS